MANKRWKDPVTIATVAMALVAGCNGLIYFFMWRTYESSLALTQKSVELTSRMMEATNRPFVSPLTLELVQIEPQKKAALTFELKNVGNVPANRITLESLIYIDGVLVQGDEQSATSNPSTLVPNQSIGIESLVGDPAMYSGIINGKKELRAKITIRYFGIVEEGYYSYLEGHYDASRQAFKDLRGEVL